MIIIITIRELMMMLKLVLRLTRTDTHSDTHTDGDDGDDDETEEDDDEHDRLHSLTPLCILRLLYRPPFLTVGRGYCYTATAAATSD